MKKLFLRMASLALSCIFLISQTPILAKEMINSLVNLSNSYDTSKVEILGEILEKRSDFTKHFRMNDGSIMAVTYTDKIHYKDGEEFKGIDNTLIKDENDNYKNTQNDFKVNFSKILKIKI